MTLNGPSDKKMTFVTLCSPGSYILAPKYKSKKVKAQKYTKIYEW